MRNETPTETADLALIHLLSIKSHSVVLEMTHTW